MTGQIVMGITGASGAAYARRLIELLVRAGRGVHLVISPAGRQLLADELGLTEVTPRSLLGGGDAGRVKLYPHDDLAAVISSGSFRTDGMAVCPCSSNTLAAIASGLADNLITRAAHVTLKERRPLVLVTRETPLSPIEIENMAGLSRAGAILCPASPGFYHHPRTIEDLVDFVVAKVLDLLGVEHDLKTRYTP
ncbi:MAG: UbiX family flavin prenyltransferase [Phycisphaerae bacterium]|nr:UbiX family flavin prenyltransferase [Phycisphaerae bacterium]